IILEPFQGAAGVIPASPSYLQHAQQLAERYGALFILDEVQSLRNSYYGVQQDLGITPDLTILGKIIGGGYPIGAVVGKTEHLLQTSPYTAGHLVHSGTFNGHLTSRSEEHTSELQSRFDLVCRLLLEKKKYYR